ncbi:MAG: hypothetical protein H6607_02585 [Flavobacteriales bacterium]|nr:hypothetical protein [Flavobacteriales bacterium]
MKKIVLLLVMGFLTLLTTKTFATHLMGADITYTCDSAYAYTVKIVYYRYCAGTAMANPSAQTNAVNVKTGAKVGITLTLQSIEDITQVCSSVSKPCYPANTYSNAGMERLTYIGNVDLQSSKYGNMLSSGNCVVRIETSQCCRNTTITTGGANQNFYTYATINVCLAPVNNSPQFITDPVAFLCCNKPYYGNVGGFDNLDFDSLSYRFAPPITGYNLYTSYSGSYSYNNPFTVYYPGSLKPPYNNPYASPPIGLFLDEETGRLVFTPVNCSEVTIAVLEITEWRKDSIGVPQIIGVTRRDMQYNISQCNENNPPKIKTNTIVDIDLTPCQKEVYCFNVTTEDKVAPIGTYTPSADTVKFIQYDLPAGITMTVTNPKNINPTAKICIDPTQVDEKLIKTGYVQFPITVTDNHCPQPAITTEIITVLIKNFSQFGKVEGAVVLDINGNCQKDSSEINISQQRKVLVTGTSTNQYVNANGTYQLCLRSGLAKVKLAPNQWFNDVCVEDSVVVVIDSTHTINFFTQLKPGIAGYVFTEAGECKTNSFTQPVAGQMVVAQPGNHYAVTDKYGFYLFDIDTGSYKIALVNDTTHWKSRCKDSISVHFSAGETKFVDTFFNYHVPEQNVSVSIAFNSGKTIKRGHPFYAHVKIKNNGTYTVASSKVILSVDSTLPDLYKSYSGWKYKGGGNYEVNFTNLNPGYTNSYYMYLTADTSYQVGDSIRFYAVTDTAQDVTPADNEYLVDLRVVGPHDPNRKTAQPDSIFTTTDRMLTYTVQFQNDGSAAATDVIVRDTLSNKFDLSTLQMETGSHNFSYSLDGNKLWVHFENINLPPKKADSLRCMGSFTFKIKLREDIFEETFIKNRVGIYFDFEDVVMTGYQINHFKSPMEFVGNPKKVYCKEDTLKLPFVAWFKPIADNMFILEMTDSSGNHNTFSAIDTLFSTSTQNTFKLLVSDYFQHSSSNYAFRIKSTDAVTQSFVQAYLKNINIELLNDAKLQISDTEICYGQKVQVKSNEAYFTNRLFAGTLKLLESNKAEFESDSLMDGMNLFMEHEAKYGCKSYTDTVLMTVWAVPTISIFSDSNTCYGNSKIDFLPTIHFGKGRTTTDTLLWNFGDGSSNVSFGSGYPSHNYADGNYLMKVSLQNGICFDSTSQNIEIGINPKITIDSLVDNICPEQEVVLFFTSNTQHDIQQIDWNFDNGKHIFSKTVPKYSYPESGNYQISAILKDTMGCSDTSFAAINIAIAPKAKIINDKLAACSNDAQFLFKKEISGDIVGYKWIVDNTEYTSDSLETPLSVGTHNVYLVALSSGICNDTVGKSVVVYPYEKAEFDLDSDLCSNQELLLMSKNVTTTTKYTWQFFGKKITAQSIQHTLQDTTAGTYSVKLNLITKDGCTDSIFRSFDLQKMPKADFETQDVCLGYLIELTNLSSEMSDNSEVAIVWGDGMKLDYKKPKNDYSHSYLAGNYIVTLFAKTDFCVDSMSKSVQVFDPSQADFDHHPAATDELLIEFENQSTNADSSFWKFGQNADEVWNNSPVVSQRFDHPGYYLVQLVAKTQHGCVDTLVKRIMVESDFNFFIPNTFSPGRTDGLNDHFVVVPSEYIKSIDFQLINRLGQTVVQSNNPNRLIDKELMPGIYMYKSKIIDLNGREYEYEGVVHIW